LRLAIFRWGSARSVPIIKENLDRIHVGMTAKEIEAILGEPTEGITGKGWNIWGGPDGKCSISVWYDDGKVVGKEGRNL
jgi:hypothetical protein